MGADWVYRYIFSTLKKYIPWIVFAVHSQTCMIKVPEALVYRISWARCARRSFWWRWSTTWYSVLGVREFESRHRLFILLSFCVCIRYFFLEVWVLVLGSLVLVEVGPPSFKVKLGRSYSQVFRPKSLKCQN